MIIYLRILHYLAIKVIMSPVAICARIYSNDKISFNAPCCTCISTNLLRCKNRNLVNRLPRSSCLLYQTYCMVSRIYKNNSISLLSHINVFGIITYGIVKAFIYSPLRNPTLWCLDDIYQCLFQMSFIFRHRYQ